MDRPEQHTITEMEQTNKLLLIKTPGRVTMATRFTRSQPPELQQQQI